MHPARSQGISPKCAALIIGDDGVFHGVLFLLARDERWPLPPRPVGGLGSRWRPAELDALGLGVGEHIHRCPRTQVRSLGDRATPLGQERTHLVTARVMVERSAPNRVLALSAGSRAAMDQRGYQQVDEELVPAPLSASRCCSTWVCRAAFAWIRRGHNCERLPGWQRHAADEGRSTRLRAGASSALGPPVHQGGLRSPGGRGLLGV